MTTPLEVAKLAPAQYQALFAVSRALGEGEIPAALKHLVDLRVSQINGCGFCIALHATEALKGGEAKSRTDAVANWYVSGAFTDAERAAFAYAEALTRCDEPAIAEASRGLGPHFTPRQVAELTLVVGVINAWNRVGIAAHAAAFA